MPSDHHIWFVAWCAADTFFGGAGVSLTRGAETHPFPELHGCVGCLTLH